MKSRGSNSTPFKDNVVQLLSHSLSAVLSLSRSSLRSSPSSTLPPSLFCFGNRRCRGLHRRQGSLLRGSPSPAELAAVIAGCLSLPISVGNRRVGGHRLRRSPCPAELSLIIADARGSPHSALSRRPAVSRGQITRRLVECVRNCDRFGDSCKPVCPEKNRKCESNPVGCRFRYPSINSQSEYNFE
ncbi:hypothetical protein Dimus_001467 [Dionaea muscipula]